MTTINLKRYYPYMTENVMLEVSDEIAAALSMGGRLCDSYKRQKRRNGECSLDAQEQNIALANYRRKKLSQTGIRGSNGNIKYLTFDEASYLAKVSRSMINKWADKGKFTVIKVGSRVRILRDEFEDWMEQRDLERSMQ